jgi:hypothetical protein
VVVVMADTRHERGRHRNRVFKLWQQSLDALSDKSPENERVG